MKYKIGDAESLPESTIYFAYIISENIGSERQKEQIYIQTRVFFWHEITKYSRREVEYESDTWRFGDIAHYCQKGAVNVE